MFQEDMNGKDESGVYEIKYGDHMFFVPKRMDDGVEAIMAMERICCRGFSFKRKRKSLSDLCAISGRLRLMRIDAKLLAGLNGNLPAEMMAGETETTGCICCGLLFVLPAVFAASLLYFAESMLY